MYTSRSRSDCSSMMSLLFLCITAAAIAKVDGKPNNGGSESDDVDEGMVDPVNVDPASLNCFVRWPPRRCRPEEKCAMIFGQYECIDKRPSGICFYPKKTGRCRAFFPRYYYNSKTKQCERFIYGGCGANPNNFKTLEKCELVCMPV